MYGARVREEITGDLIQANYVQALQENDLRPAGMPQVEIADVETGFTFVANFEVYPEFTLDGIDGIEVSKSVASVEMTDVDVMLEKLREQKDMGRI